MNTVSKQASDNPRVSIVTISYNQGRYLERAIQSVLSQTYENIEYIVVDAGSSDESLEIIDQYRDRIATVICKPDNGPADGLNKGFGCATGDICGYINADDYYLPDAIMKAVDFFSVHKNADIVSGHCYIVNEITGKTSFGTSEWFDPLKASLETCFLMQQSTFFRYGVYKAVGGFNVDNRSCWDIELIIDAALSGKQVRILDKIMSVFRIHAESISGSRCMMEDYRKDMDRLFRKVSGRERRLVDRYRKVWLHLERIPQRVALIPFYLRNTPTRERL